MLDLVVNYLPYIALVIFLVIAWKFFLVEPKEDPDARPKRKVEAIRAYDFPKGYNVNYVLDWVEHEMLEMSLDRTPHEPVTVHFTSKTYGLIQSIEITWASRQRFVEFYERS